MHLIEPLILLVFGILLITSPRIFTRAEGDQFEPTRAKLKKAGLLFTVIGVVFLILVLIRGV